MSRLLLLLAGLVLAAAPLEAQNYGTAASQMDLEDGGVLTNPEPQCIAYFADDGIEGFLFFDATSQQIVAHALTDIPGFPQTIIGVTAEDLDAAVALDIDRCRDVAIAPDVTAFMVLSNADNQDVVVRVEGTDASLTLLTSPGSTVDNGDGVSGLTVSADGQTVYLARSEFNGAPEDGFYSLAASTAGQQPTPVLVNADLDLVGLGITPGGDLIASSSEFGGGDFTNVVVMLDDPAGSPSLSVIATPCDGATPLFSNCTDGGIEDLTVGSTSFFVFNNAFAGDNGEEIGQFNLDGSNGQLIFTQTDFLASADVTGTEFTPAGSGAGFLTYDDANGILYLAGDSDFGGDAIGIFSVSPTSTASEPTLPDATFALVVYPNPAAGPATVRVTVDTAQTLDIAAYDVLGRRVAVLFSGTVTPGQPVTATLDGLALPAGTYVVRAAGPSGTATQRVTLVR